jgi:hypothetical protein
MKPLANTLFNALAGTAFLCAGVAILVWDIGKLRQVGASLDWPTAEGTVVSSGIDKRERETKPHVVYTYAVGGIEYTSTQISFDLFDKPGGEGRVETIVARYPEGKQVAVHFDPGSPATAVLEPGVYSPFFMPLLFGVLFVLGGLWAASGC